MSSHSTSRHASFSERTVAFSIDASLFAAGWVLTLRALDASAPVTAHPKGAAAALLWGALFVAYQAVFSSEGRVTLGKRLLGLRVVGHDGEAPTLAHGIGRALGYLVSQFFTAGFLWALIDPNGRALHDLPFATLVVSDRPQRGARALATRFAAAALIAGFAGLYAWENVYAPRYERIMTVAHARHALREYAVLQRTYKQQHGVYAQNVFALATVSMDPRGFLEDSAKLYDRGAVGITAGKDGFSIAARANDVDKTLVAISGP